MGLDWQPYPPVHSTPHPQQPLTMQCRRPVVLSTHSTMPLSSPIGSTANRLHSADSAAAGRQVGGCNGGRWSATMMPHVAAARANCKMIGSACSTSCKARWHSHHHNHPPQVQVAAAGRWVGGKEAVDHARRLHHAIVLWYSSGKKAIAERALAPKRTGWQLIRSAQHGSFMAAPPCAGRPWAWPGRCTAGRPSQST